MSSGDIITALATPPGTSALALVRLSGTGSVEIIEEMMALRPGSLLEGRGRAVGSICGGNGPLDHVVAISWPRGRSYTGEEMVEVSCHGTERIINSIIGEVCSRGARLAEPGEFTRRAYLNGKMTPFDVMALAAAMEGREDAPSVLGGKFADRCGELRRRMQILSEEIEGRIEFEEEHGLDGVEGRLEALIKDLRRDVASLRKMALSLTAMGRIIIMGPRNAGKSTLVNLLAGTEVAVVDDRPGTTIDGASIETVIEGRRMRVADSPGAVVEGVDARAFEIALSNLDESCSVVWMSAGGRDPVPEAIERAAGRVLEVSSKADECPPSGFALSSFTGKGIDELKRWMASEGGSASPVAAVDEIASGVMESMDAVYRGDLPLAAESLNGAEEVLDSLLQGRGRQMELAVERALGRLCVGK